MLSQPSLLSAYRRIRRFLCVASRCILQEDISFKRFIGFGAAPSAPRYMTNLPADVLFEDARHCTLFQEVKRVEL
jgi:hypothetical protein